MNAKKFGEGQKMLSVEEAIRVIRKEFDNLQNAIFGIMPEGCFLRMWNVLSPVMLCMLSPEMIEKKIVDQKDICALCPAEGCPFNKVDHKNLRIIKVKLLQNLYNR